MFLLSTSSGRESYHHGDLREALLRAADATPDPREALVAQGVAYVDFALAEPALFRLMFSAQAPARTADLAEAGDAAFAVLAARVDALAPAGAGDWALACWAMVHGIAALVVDGVLPPGPDTPALLTERLVRLLPIAER